MHDHSLTTRWATAHTPTANMSSFTIESWTWCAVTLLMITARYIARIWHFRSIRKLMVEDWFMAFLTVRY